MHAAETLTLTAPISTSDVVIAAADYTMRSMFVVTAAADFTMSSAFVGTAEAVKHCLLVFVVFPPGHVTFIHLQIKNQT